MSTLEFSSRMTVQNIRNTKGKFYHRMCTRHNSEFPEIIITFYQRWRSLNKVKSRIPQRRNAYDNFEKNLPFA